ncbi:LacI family DNA-binding transcriptional regulator [Promicromonospora thailandica]|uniref:Transcriptional regulator, LacI family n=1 Tax=Promicromonospora thailandica TaxID=765201 RepID=A0A9X2JW79_9MICO|nr:LacI family DNA-binding transcriptional regulator [Promicromonospora thailandica]MCP2265861.1 transcriptional regulator, LacI family [Promicromonospora thailandica]BFF21578.1 LacI family DNA-binding transcriptional regulator [Promicromonospora thailandica]
MTDESSTQDVARDPAQNSAQHPAATGRRATIWEVARAAGVSHQTVSRYLRNDAKMRPETVARIRTAVRDLDYRPNLTARSMRTRRSGRIAVLLPAVATYGPPQILSGVMEVAHEHGYTIEAFSVEGGPAERFERVLELADSGQVEGVLALAPLPPESEHRFPDRAAIVVSADYDDEFRGVGELADGSPVAELVEQLAALGHRKFLHVTGALDFASARGRRDVFVQTIERLGLGPALVHESDWSAEGGRAAVHTLPERDHPTAIIAASDVGAAGVVLGARERGWSIPGDLSVTGWDNNQLGAYLQPTLTTVHVDHRKLGRAAMARLVATLRPGGAPEAGPGSGTTTPEPPLNTIIWRESTGPVS